jgi:hypothetical protein
MTVDGDRVAETSTPNRNQRFSMEFHRISSSAIMACLWVCAALVGPGPASSKAAEQPAAADSRPQRVTGELQVLYDFRSPEGPTIQDRSGAAEPLDLRIADKNAVRRSAQGLEVVGNVSIASEKPASRLIESIRQSGAVTIEAWIRPANTNQKGPARILTVSRNTTERNLTLGQEGDKFDVRLRTSSTDANGMPAVASKEKMLTTELTHVIYTHERSGRTRIYVNGKLNVEQNVGGATSNWDGGYRLALANELSHDRPWQGTYRLLAIYSRELLPKEVEQNFRAGADARTIAGPPAPSKDNARLFESQIAPLLSKHCLECHDGASKKGALDLSHKVAALAGGDDGPAFVPGQSADSLVWQVVQSDKMPRNRPPLSPEEKGLLKQWIDGGAAWSLDVIEPAVYARGPGSSKVFVQRLTVPEYIETVRRTLGVDVAKEARDNLPRDVRADGFSNTAYNLTVDLAHVEAYAKLAEIIAGRIDVKALAAKYTQSRELTDENVAKIIEPVGRKLLRGPLAKEEITGYCGISTAVAGAGGNFDEALRFILKGMLQSPRFIYRVERQQGDGSARPVSPHELASRLSYILWGGPPDDALLTAADQGKLDRAGVESQTRRMLQDPRAVDRSRQFISEWLNLARLDDLRPSPLKFPNWDAHLAADMRNETLTLFEEIVWKQKRPLADLLNARVTFVTPRLAKHYGLPLDKLPAGNDVVPYDLSSLPGRGGLLAHGSVLTIGGDEASMVTRGLFVMHELLRGEVRDPPPCVDTTPVPTKPGLTQRAIAESRLANQKCAGCHAKFEPLSFGLERFDGLGSYREVDQHGNQLQDDGVILFPGQENPISYRSSGELMDVMAKNDRVRESLTWKLTQFALGRPLGADDARVMADIHRASQQGGGTYASLMTAIVLSDLVQKARTEPAVPAPSGKNNNQ